MAQIITARLARIDSQPWGFRLQGGKDFGTPLVIQKVHTGSIADKAGLQAGDAVVRINQTDLFNLRHKDAQDAIVQAGPSFELVVQRGGATWKPTVTPISSAAASPIPGNFTPVTKTSLAANKQPVSAIGTGHNTAARPFVPPSPVRSIVNKQYNSPVAMYSEETIAETLTSQAEVLAGGCLGVNFKKNEKVYNPEKSEVLKALQENDSEPEPAGSTFYWRQSHAIGGSALTSQSPRPLTPNYQNIPDSRMGTSLQQNVLAPSATHRPSLPVHPVQPVQKTAPQPEQKQPETVNVVPKAFQTAAPPQISIDGVFVRIKDKNLHVECFKCATCGSSLKNQGYYNLNNKLYCDVHARLAAMNSPPPNSNGLVPVAVPPKNLGASTISSALNAHAGNLNGNHNLNESQISPTATLVSKRTKANDDNNNNIVCDNRYISETDCSSISSSDKENDSRPSSSHGNNINKSDITDGNDTDGFRYRTINGRVIKSVIPPGKGIKVNYKVPSNISGPKPFSYTQQPIQVTHAAIPPMAAPKSPSSYPPPNQQSWTPQSAAPVAPKPVGPVQGGLNKKLGFKPKEFIDIEKCNGKPREEEKTKKKKEEVYVPCDSEDEFDPQELVKIAKPPPSNFIWPPKIEEPKVPIAAPIYVPVPETLHVTAKPCTNVRPLGRPARQLTTQSLRTVETTSDCECLHVESNITATTSTTSNASSESEYKMYQTQNNQYVNMFEQHEQHQKQEQRHDDEVEEINKKQIEIDLRKTPPQIELPKDIKTIEFVEPEPGYKPETFLNVFSKKKETWQKLTQNVTTTRREEKYQEYLSIQQMDDNPENSDVEEEEQVNTMEDIQQEDTEVEEINEKKEVIVEKQDQEQHTGPHDGTYYQLAPSNIPQPVPKGYQSSLQKALVYSSDKPYSIRNMPPTPEPRFPCLDLYERAVREAATETEEEKEPPKKREIPKFEVKTTKEHRDFPHNEQEVRQGNTLLSSMMRTASPRQMEFVKSNIIEEIPLPDELDAYFPPPISMVPNEPYPSLNPCRTKSPFVSALTTVSDRPFTPFGREIKSQLSFESPQCNAPKSTFSNALHTAPDESFDPSSLEFEYIENNPIEYTAKVYERIAVEATGDEETTVSTYQHVESYPVMNQDPYQRAYIHKIQPWSTPSEQIAENTYRDSYSGSHTSTECLVSDSRRCSKAVNECAVSDSRRTSRAANEYTVSDSRRTSRAANEGAVCDSRRCSEAVNEPCCVKKNIRDLLKFDEPEEEFDPEQPCPNAPYPRRQDLPSPFEGMQVKVTNKMTSGLHKPDEIPQYQRKWFNLPTQNPPRTPEPEELRENVAVAFKEWHETKQLISSQSESIQRKEIRVTFAEKPPIPHDTNTRRGSVSEKIQWMEQTKAMTSEQEEVKFPTKSGQRHENAFPTRSISIEEEIYEDEERDGLGEMRFPTRLPKPTPVGAFPLKGIRKNSIADIEERQEQQFEKQKTLKQELEMQQQKMLQKNRVRQQKELQSMQQNYEKLAQNSIVEEIQQNKTLSAYEQEQEYKRQLELEKQQRQKEKELKEQQAKELEYQRQIEEKKLQEIRFQEKRERDIQIQAQREAEYQKHREEQEEALRIQQEERDREMRRQQEEIEKEILKQQEQERRDAERREARRLFEIRRKEERDRELVRLETELREKREQELKQLEREIREKREQRQREEKEAEIQLQQERKAREDAEKEAKRLEQEAIRLQKDRERQLQTELKMRQKQEADRKQREEMELFNIEEERKRNEQLVQKAKAYQSTTYQQQMVWPPSVSSTPAQNQSTNQTPMPIPIIKTDSDTELNAPKFHFEPLDEEQKRFMAGIRPPSTCYSPPTEEKPYPSIPYYQQHLAFYETAPDHCGIFDPRSISPAPIQNRSRSPAFGPPPNPMRAFINKERDPVVDESGIYLCGERLLSPVWYEKGNKKIPPPVQRRIHPHAPTSHPPPKPDLEAIKESIRHKRQGTQESSTKPPPTPPPMPKTSYKATLPGVKNEAPEIKTQTIPITNNKESMIATDLLKESVDRLNINSQNSDFRKNASSVLAAMLEARMIKKQQNQGTKFEDPEFLPPPPPLPSTKPPNPNNQDQDLPLPPPPSPCKIPSSILTPPLSSDENDLPQKKSCGNNNIITEKVTYRHKKHHHSNNQSPDSSPSSSTSSFHGISKPELSTHARDRRSYIEKNNNNTNGHHYSGNEISFNNSVDKDTLDTIANDLANGQHPVCDKCKCKITRGPFVTALGRTWCPAHFLCVNQNCRRELMDIGFVEEKGDLYCEYCFEQFLAPPCSKCNGKIKGDCLNAIGRKFHPECFKCTYCSKLFGNNPFFLEEGEPYCEADWNELFTTKCFACGFPVEAGDRWVEALNNNYHSQCFNCTYCKKNLEGQSFFAKGGRPFCKNHAR